jgi:hypothetical protein
MNFSAVSKYGTYFQEEVRIAKEALQRTEEAADLMAEKSMIAEQVDICYDFSLHIIKKISNEIM